MLARAEGRGAEVERRDDLSPAARSRGQEQDHREHADRAGQVQADPEAHDPAADPEPDHPGPRPGRQDAQPGQGRKHDVLSDQGHLRVQVRVLLVCQLPAEVRLEFVTRHLFVERTF